MDLILHIGAHRTASTTFQSFLEENEGRLRARGIAVWTPRRTRSGLFSALVRRPEEVTLQLEQRAVRTSGLIRLEVERHRRMGLTHLIVSEENMIGAVRNNLRARVFYPGLDERLMRFREGFAGSCTRIVLGVRAYDAFWASSLAYAVARGHRVPDAGLLDRLVAQPRRWRDVVRDVAQTFPAAEVLVWPFERFAGRPEMQLAMMTGAAVPARELTALRDWRNPSPLLPELREILSLRPNVARAAVLPQGEGRWMPFDSDQRMELNLAYQMDLTWLRDGAGGFARFVEGPHDMTEDPGPEPDRNGPPDPAVERGRAADKRGHRDEGPRRAVV